MSTWAFRTMIVPSSLVVLCRQLAASFESGAGMWITPLSPTGKAPATHYISSGGIWQQFADMLSSPEALSSGTGISLSQAQTILEACDVSEEEGLTAMTRLNLRFVDEI